MPLNPQESIAWPMGCDAGAGFQDASQAGLFRSKAPESGIEGGCGDS